MPSILSTITRARIPGKSRRGHFTALACLTILALATAIPVLAQGPADQASLEQKLAGYDQLVARGDFVGAFAALDGAFVAAYPPGGPARDIEGIAVQKVEAAAAALIARDDWDAFREVIRSPRISKQMKLQIVGVLRDEVWYGE